MPKVLIVDDQAKVARAISLLLELHEAEDYEGSGPIETVSAMGPDHALAEIDRGGVDLVVQDLNFSPGKTSGDEGLKLFRRLKAADPDLPVLLITAWGSVDQAVRLMKEGASDYLEKPWDDDRLLQRVRDLLRLRRLELENRRLQSDLRRGMEELAERYDLCGLVYRSSAMHEVVSLAVRVARANVSVLITGDNGTGKDKLADVVQANSPRRSKPFVKVNVGALPESLIEAELFGAEAGAFTGADKKRVGRFEAADGGTLLLDEIGNLSASGQMKLLRVLQTGEMERLGSSKTRKVDVRVLAATNADLEAEIDAGRFREDLYFRLNVIEFEVPDLKDRPDDILPLAESFLTQAGVAGEAPKPLSRAAREALRAHNWPGNVRELRNAIQRAALVATGDEIRPADLGLDTRPPTMNSVDLPDDEAGQKRTIEGTLLEHGGVVAHAAESVGLSRQALYRRMQKLGIVLERKPRSP